jgi:short-subunit dehydrogenase
VARTLAREGVNVTMNARDNNRLQKATREIGALGARAISISGDLTESSVRAELVAKSLEEFGSIEILINNAGAEPITSFAAQTEEDIIKTIELNLTATLLLTRQVIPLMLSQKRGHIVTVASGAGKKGQAYAATYSATKAGQVKWAEGLRAELKGTGVDISVVCPSMVRGAGVVKEFADATGTRPPRLATVSPQQVAEAVLKAITKNSRENIVQPGPIRLLLAFDLLFPSLGDRIARILRVHEYFQKVAEWRSRPS